VMSGKVGFGLVVQVVSSSVERGGVQYGMVVQVLPSGVGSGTVRYGPVSFSCAVVVVWGTVG